MKGFPVFVMLFLLPLLSCENRERERALNQKEASLNQKEQDLILKEKTLQLREEELNAREHKADTLLRDSLLRDSLHRINPVLAGKWQVNMTCTEASCSGSAVGDSRTEEWHISYEGNNLLASAMTGDQLVRVYTGFFTGNTIELVAVRDHRTNTAVRMVARLTLVDDVTMEGQREIVRENNCKVVYALQMKKIK